MAKMAILSTLALAAVCALILQASAQSPSSQAFARGPGGGGGRFRPQLWPPWAWSRLCRRNEVYKHCVSSSCSETKCWRPRVGPACTMDCRYGCFCKDGFYRNRKGKCVRWRQCFKGGRPKRPSKPRPRPQWPQRQQHRPE
uniref:Putative trypsin inhibitor like cysteine rich domain protein n=1 Tax=Amblyomma tuberculatum TaxID=48802 RepID=A0A6M2E3D9_9ACAR